MDITLIQMLLEALYPVAENDNIISIDVTSGNEVRRTEI